MNLNMNNTTSVREQQQCPCDRLMIVTDAHNQFFTICFDCGNKLPYVEVAVKEKPINKPR